jgi:hypothetical protein
MDNGIIPEPAKPNPKNAFFKFFRSFRFRTLLPFSPGKSRSQAAKFVQSTSDLMRGMSNVEELVICGPYQDPEDFEYVIQVVLFTGWTTFGSTLRCLKLYLSYPHFSSAFMPTFARLEELDITMWTSDFLRCHLSLFVNNHHSTLQSLKLILNGITPTDGLDGRSCLLGIDNLPHLKTFHFSGSYHLLGEEPPFLCLRNFLAIHSTVLRELRLDFLCVARKEQHEHPAFRVVLPCLESLVLGQECCRYWEQIPGYLRKHAPTLVTLKLVNIYISFQQVEELVEQLAEHDKLRSLTISIYCVTPELLDLLAIKLPSLGHLSMVFRRLCSLQSPPTTWDTEGHLVRTQHTDELTYSPA